MVSSSNMNCPFCDIIDNNPERILREKENVIVISSNPRLMYGHLLVIPKRHVEKLSQLNEEEIKELWRTLIEFQEKILGNIAPGCDIRINYRPFQKQDGLKVNHLHVRLEPRELFDELYEKCQIYEKEVYKDLPEEDRKKLRKELGIKK